MAPASSSRASCAHVGAPEDHGDRIAQHSPRISGKASDLAALRALDKRPDRSVELAPKTRDQILTEIAAEIKRLDRLIPQIEGELRMVIQSASLQLKLEATMARRQGRDLLGEMASELRVEIARFEAELASLS